jgi:hypothetical protein
MKLLLDWQPPFFFSPSSQIPPKKNAGWYRETARESHAQQRTVGWMPVTTQLRFIHCGWMNLN